MPALFLQLHAARTFPIASLLMEPFSLILVHRLCLVIV